MKRCPALDGRLCLACAPAERCPEQLALEARARAAARRPCIECGHPTSHETNCGRVD